MIALIINFLAVVLHLVYLTRLKMGEDKIIELYFILFVAPLF